MFPDSFIQIQNSASLYGKLRVTRKDPGTVMPWFDGVFIKPSPYGAIADGGVQ